MNTKTQQECGCPQPRDAPADPMASENLMPAGFARLWTAALLNSKFRGPSL